MFNCDCCGCCCRNLDKSNYYAKLDRGDGVCKYLSGNLCSIYNERPLLCRIDECYDIYFSKFIDRKQYYELNTIECQKLKNPKTEE